MKRWTKKELRALTNESLLVVLEGALEDVFAGYAALEHIGHVPQIQNKIAAYKRVASALGAEVLRRMGGDK